MNLERAFSYVNEDESWISKILIGGLIYFFGSFIIIGPIAFQGYVIETARNVMQGKQRPLPEWNNFGEKLSVGFASVVISLVYVLPLLLLLFVVGIIVGVSGAAAGDNQTAGGAVGLLALCMFGLIFLAAIALVPLSLAATVRYVQTGSISAALQFGEVIAMVRKSPSTWAMLFGVAILSSFIGGLGAIACYIGSIATIPYGQAVFAHALGQVAAQTAGAQPGYEQTPPSYTPPPTYQ